MLFVALHASAARPGKSGAGGAHRKALDLKLPKSRVLSGGDETQKIVGKLVVGTGAALRFPAGAAQLRSPAAPLVCRAFPSIGSRPEPGLIPDDCPVPTGKILKILEETFSNPITFPALYCLRLTRPI